VDLLNGFMLHTFGIPLCSIPCPFPTSLFFFLPHSLALGDFVSISIPFPFSGVDGGFWVGQLIGWVAVVFKQAQLFNVVARKSQRESERAKERQPHHNLEINKCTVELKITKVRSYKV